MSTPPATPAPTSTPPRFPSKDEYARKFFVEARRHLEDARILHQAARYPAAITSSMKAAEIAIKAVLILEGSLGWWEKLQQTHEPFNEIRQHALLKYHSRALEQHSPTLIAGLTALEKLAPSRPDKGPLTFETQANTEYPFFYLQPPAASGAEDTGHRVGPAEYFTEAESLKHYRTAHELMAVYQMLHAEVAAWGVGLPAAL
jgi:hypothetical protein